MTLDEARELLRKWKKPIILEGLAGFGGQSIGLSPEFLDLIEMLVDRVEALENGEFPVTTEHYAPKYDWLDGKIVEIGEPEAPRVVARFKPKT